MYLHALVVSTANKYRMIDNLTIPRFSSCMRPTHSASHWQKMISIYIGFIPTCTSFSVHNLWKILMILKWTQLYHIVTGPRKVVFNAVYSSFLTDHEYSKIEQFQDCPRAPKQSQYLTIHIDVNMTFTHTSTHTNTHTHPVLLFSGHSTTWPLKNWQSTRISVNYYTASKNR